jgi:hypothetical protein
VSFAQMTDTGQALLVAAAVREPGSPIGAGGRLLRYAGIRVDTPAGLHNCTPGGAGQRSTQVVRMCGGRRCSSGAYAAWSRGSTSSAPSAPARLRHRSGRAPGRRQSAAQFRMAEGAPGDRGHRSPSHRSRRHCARLLAPCSLPPGVPVIAATLRTDTTSTPSCGGRARDGCRVRT